MEPKIIISIILLAVLVAVIAWRNWPRKKTEIKEETETDTLE